MDRAWIPAVVLVCAALILSSGCMGTTYRVSVSMPDGSRPDSPATALATESIVARAAPRPTLGPASGEPLFVQKGSEYRGTPGNLTEIYRGNHTLTYGAEAFLVTLVRPPLIIDYSVAAANADTNFGYLVVTVRDEAAGQVIAQDGYGRTYSIENPKRIVVTSPGTYHVNLYGNLVSVDLRMRAAG